MRTIKVAENVTMTLTERKARQWDAYKEAEANLRLSWGNEYLDWEDYEDLEIEVWDAWERFCS